MISTIPRMLSLVFELLPLPLAILYLSSAFSLLVDLDLFSLLRFSQLFCAGGICAFLTHAACVPIDVVKTKMQTSSRFTSATHCLRTIIHEEGASVLLKGFSATAAGYFLHGAFKYSFYEFFKLSLIPDTILALKPPLHIAAFSGFLAECVASVVLCPMEAIRIRSVSEPSFPNTILAGLAVIHEREGVGGLFKGLPSILLKQVPYTVGQFVAFEYAVLFVKALVATIIGGLDFISPSGAAAISLFSGLIAGVFAGIISQPGDTILSKVNAVNTSSSAGGTSPVPSSNPTPTKTSSNGVVPAALGDEELGASVSGSEPEEEGSVAAMIRVARTLGAAGLFTGLGTRLVQVALMIGGQFLIYDTVKMWCGIKVASAVTSATVSAAAAAASSSASASTAVSGTATARLLVSHLLSSGA